MFRFENITRGVSKGRWAGLTVLVLAYFAYHALSGDSSLAALKRLEAKESAFMLQAEQVAVRREFLEQRIAGLSSAVVDIDLLEGQVRKRLGFVHSDEVIVLLN